MGGRLYALAHGVRQKLAHIGVAAVRGVDAAEIERLDASGQRGLNACGICVREIACLGTKMAYTYTYMYASRTRDA